MATAAVQNLLGDESERTVSLHLDTAKPDAPEIQALDVAPVSPGSFAPATFRVTGKVKNAQMCVWSSSDDRPMEFVKDDLAAQDRLLTFDRPGSYVIKLAAVNDTHTAQPSGTSNSTRASQPQARSANAGMNRITFGPPSCARPPSPSGTRSG